MTAMTQFQTKGHKFEYKWLMPKVMKTDPLYQRELSQKRITKVVDDWDYDLVNTPKVSQRTDGKYYIFDGQHTVAAWSMHEGENVPILCKVYTGLTWEEEKTLFLKQNGLAVDPTTADKLRAEFNANNPDVRGMYNACSEAGVKVYFSNHGGHNRYQCVAVSALYGTYMSISKQDFTRIMQLIVDAWGGESLSLSAGFIKGLKKVYQMFSDRIKDKEMAKSLSKYTPEYYVREAREIGGSLETKFSTVFLRVYNKNRSAGRLVL